MKIIDTFPNNNHLMWRKINGFDYEVSDQGEVRNSAKQIMTVHTTNTGYDQVKIAGKYKLVHRLVAETFLPNPGNLPVVDHINGDRSDNRKENLQWITYSGNSKKGNMARGAKNKPICQYDMSGNLIKEWPSATEASKATGIAQQNISQNCCGSCKSAGGYRWAFKGDNLAEYVTDKKPHCQHTHSSEYLDKQQSKLDAYKADWASGIELKDLRKTYGTQYVKDHPLQYTTERGIYRLIRAIC